MMKTHHSQLSLIERITVFLFVTGLLPALCFPSGSTEVGLSAGDTGIIYAVLSVSRAFRSNLLWIHSGQTWSAQEPALVSDQPAHSFWSGLLLFGYLLQINVLLGSIFGGIYIGLTFNGGEGYWSPIPSVSPARASLSSARRGCGDRLAGRWQPFRGTSV